MKTAICILYILVISLAGWLAYTCYWNFQFDANNTAGIIVSTLGVLVAILTGWQVFNAIEMRGILKKVDDIKNTYKKSTDLLNQHDLELMCLLEAFQLSQHAKQAEQHGNKYCLTLKAILQFLRANVKMDYIPFNGLIESLPSMLDKAEKLNKIDRIQFAKADRDCENVYDDIIKIIDNKKELKPLKCKIKDSRDRRKKINEGYEGKDELEFLNEIYADYDK